MTTERLEFPATAGDCRPGNDDSVAALPRVTPTRVPRCIRQQLQIRPSRCDGRQISGIKLESIGTVKNCG